jgi:hypothetical protein
MKQIALIYAIAITMAFIVNNGVFCAQAQLHDNANAVAAVALDADEVSEKLKKEEHAGRSTGGLWVAVYNDETEQQEPYFLPEETMKILAQYGTRLGEVWKHAADAQVDMNNKPVINGLPFAGGATRYSRVTLERFVEFIKSYYVGYRWSTGEIHKPKSLYYGFDWKVSGDPMKCVKEAEELFAFLLADAGGADCPLVTDFMRELLWVYKVVLEMNMDLYFTNHPTLQPLCFMLDKQRTSPLDITNEQLTHNPQVISPIFECILRDKHFLKSPLAFALLQRQELACVNFPQAVQSASLSADGSMVACHEGGGQVFVYFVRNAQKQRLSLPLLVDERGQAADVWQLHFSERGSWLVVTKSYYDRGFFLQNCKDPSIAIDLPGAEPLRISSDERWLCWGEHDRHEICLLDLTKSIDPKRAIRFTCGSGSLCGRDGRSMYVDHGKGIEISSKGSQKIKFILQQNDNDVPNVFEFSLQDLAAFPEGVIHNFAALLEQGKLPVRKMASILTDNDFGKDGNGQEYNANTWLNGYGKNAWSNGYEWEESIKRKNGLHIPENEIVHVATSNSGLVVVWKRDNSVVAYQLGRYPANLTLRQLLVLGAMYFRADGESWSSGVGSFRPDAKNALGAFIHELPEVQPIINLSPAKSLREVCEKKCAVPQEPYKDAYKYSGEALFHRYRPYDHNPHSFFKPQNRWLRYLCYGLMGAAVLYGGYKLRKYYSTKRLARLARAR